MGAVVSQDKAEFDLFPSRDASEIEQVRAAMISGGGLLPSNVARRVGIYDLRLDWLVTEFAVDPSPRERVKVAVVGVVRQSPVVLGVAVVDGELP